jgi:hypothetical protein
MGSDVVVIETSARSQAPSGGDKEIRLVINYCFI